MPSSEVKLTVVLERGDQAVKLTTLPGGRFRVEDGRDVRPAESLAEAVRIFLEMGSPMVQGKQT